MKPYRLVAFDWDGTLMDSTARISQCLVTAAAEVDLPPLELERACSIIGLGLPQAIRALYPGIAEDQLQAMRARYAHHYIAAEEQPSPLFPGVLTVLEQLKEAGVLLAVATGKNRPGLERVLSSSGLRPWFDASRTADETESKPHPAMLQELMQQFDVSPQQALMVGDTSFDLEMAQRAGVHSVGVSYGAHDVPTLRRYQPLRIIDRLQDLLPLVSGAKSR